jgi:TRAP-type mannitol/chloroaromatic compound transport system substrate-binding protein
MTFPGALSPLPQNVLPLQEGAQLLEGTSKALIGRSHGQTAASTEAASGPARSSFPGSKLYEAMQRGTIDAFEYSTAGLQRNMQFQRGRARLLRVTSLHGGLPAITRCFSSHGSGEQASRDLKAIVQNVVSIIRRAARIPDQESITGPLKASRRPVKVVRVPKDIGRRRRRRSGTSSFVKSSRKPIFAEIFESMRPTASAYQSTK